MDERSSKAPDNEKLSLTGGTTAAALDAFARGGFAELVDTAVDAATRRGRELAGA